MPPGSKIPICPLAFVSKVFSKIIKLNLTSVSKLPEYFAFTDIFHVPISLAA